MRSPFKYSDDNKRYHTLSYHYRRLGIKTKKVVIDAGLTCPNIDGSRSVGGCIFCDGGSGYFTNSPLLSISEQIKLEEERIRAKYPEVKLIGYFQAHTNTYCSDEHLESMLHEAVNSGSLDFLSVATRPDCLSETNILILKKYSGILPLTVELGLQSASDRTGRLINRAYDTAVFLSAMQKLKASGLRTCVHVINGLPGENRDDMLATAKLISEVKPEGVKIHLLHVIRGTGLAEMYLAGNYTHMEFDEYIDVVVSQLELLPPETVIERITGDADRTKLLAPLWSRDKIRVLGTIDAEMAKRDTYQGRLFVAD